MTQEQKEIAFNHVIKQVASRVEQIESIHGGIEKTIIIGNCIAIHFEDKSVYKQSFISKDTTQIEA